MSRRQPKSKHNLMSQHQIVEQYGIPKKMIRQFFPKPQLKTVRMKGGAYWNIGVWPREQVEKMLEHPEIT